MFELQERERGRRVIFRPNGWKIVFVCVTVQGERTKRGVGVGESAHEQCRTGMWPVKIRFEGRATDRNATSAISGQRFCVDLGVSRQPYVFLGPSPVVQLR